VIKTVQIRSFVKGGNHGQYLQALGLAELIKDILPSADVTHLDYENHFWKELKIQTFGGMLPKFLAMRYYWSKNFRFSGLTKVSDVSVYGSDMIWHMDSDLFSTDKKMFGGDDNAKYKVSYAPSVGYRIENEPKWVSEMLDDFLALGVRDRNTEALVTDYSKHASKMVIDPCFHLMNSSYSGWFKNQAREEFVSVYSPLHNHFIDTFKESLELSDLPGFVGNTKLLGYFPRNRFLHELPKQFTDPMWTVQQIARSKLLITTTFHGVMMALMTRTPFIAVMSPNLIARLDSPIANVFSSERLMSMGAFKELNNQQLEKFLNDSDLSAELLNNYIQYSRDWLNEILTIIKL
jgi:hypothetical protein